MSSDHRSSPWRRHIKANTVPHPTFMLEYYDPLCSWVLWSTFWKHLFPSAIPETEARCPVLCKLFLSREENGLPGEPWKASEQYVFSLEAWNRLSISPINWKLVWRIAVSSLRFTFSPAAIISHGTACKWSAGGIYAELSKANITQVLWLGYKRNGCNTKRVTTSPNGIQIML